jgi:NAD(P)H-flavin reductase/ferredoxin
VEDRPRRRRQRGGALLNVVVEGKTGSRTFACEADEPILHAGLRAGLALAYECATGTCGTCKATLVGGRVADAWPEAPGRRYLKGEAEILTCQARALEDCALQLRGAVTDETSVPLPQEFAGVLHDREMLTHDVLRFVVDLDRPLDFAAGQFALLRVPGIAGARAYSMVNFERAARRLVFVVKKKPGGALSEWLFGDGGVEGTRVPLLAPLGHAVFQPEVGKHVLCIAGGSGIAGMMAILSRACAEHYFADHDGEVFFGVRTARDAFFFDELAAFRAQCPARLAVTVALSDEDVSATLAARYPDLAFARGFVHEVAAAAMKGRYANVRAYAAGPPPMVDGVLRVLLREARLHPTDIRYDKFS